MGFSKHDPQQRPRKRSVGMKSRAQVDRVRRLVYERDHHECLARWSGIACDGPLTIQHATARGMGGSARFDGPEYLRTFCLGHNLLEAGNAGFAQTCERNGWRVPRLGYPDVDEVITRIPVRYPDGSWWLLDRTGQRTETFQALWLWRQLGAPWAGQIDQDGTLWP